MHSEASISVTFKRHQTYQHNRFDSFAVFLNCVHIVREIPHPCMGCGQRTLGACSTECFERFSHVYRILARFVVILMLDTQNNRITIHSRWTLSVFCPPLIWVNIVYVARLNEWNLTARDPWAKECLGNWFGWRRIGHSHAISWWAAQFMLTYSPQNVLSLSISP